MKIVLILKSIKLIYLCLLFSQNGEKLIWNILTAIVSIFYNWHIMALWEVSLKCCELRKTNGHSSSNLTINLRISKNELSLSEFKHLVIAFNSNWH